jgi:hypothetical protein
MQAEFLDRLSPEVRALVEALERASGVEVTVSIDAGRAGHGPEGKGILACNIEPQAVSLLTPTTDYFPDGAVVHELLHVRRLLVERVPRISDNVEFGAWHPGLGGYLTDLDNALEHLVIVPEELSLRPERVDHWGGVMATVWSGRLAQVKDAEDQRRWALLHWAFMRHVVPTSAAMAAAVSTLQRLGLTAEADEFYTRLVPKLGAKERAVRVCFDHLRLPLGAATLEYLDCRTGKTMETPLG